MAAFGTTLFDDASDLDSRSQLDDVKVDDVKVDDVKVDDVKVDDVKVDDVKVLFEMSGPEQKRTATEQKRTERRSKTGFL